MELLAKHTFSETDLSAKGADIRLDQFQERGMIDFNQCYSILLSEGDLFGHAPKSCNSPHSDYSRTD